VQLGKFSLSDVSDLEISYAASWKIKFILNGASVMSRRIV
jgi:hypothetical protein